MFKADRSIPVYFMKSDLINVRANKDPLQWCVFEVDKKTGGCRISNEGTCPIDNVISFQLKPVK